MTLICPGCQSSFAIITENAVPIKFCPFCRFFLHPKTSSEMATTLIVQETEVEAVEPESILSSISSTLQENEQFKFSIGQYKILSDIGKGGMGEVFLAYDTTMNRKIALKRIREDLLHHKQIHNRFLKEAYITSQLTHPVIIPIYSIHAQKELVYYTMPFVEGQTLKQILRDSRKQEKLGFKAGQEGSIPYLTRIFLSICQGIAYAHSKNILHRDIKLENIIVGKYGEVLILDWGLAQMIKGSVAADEIEITEIERNPIQHITRLGKVVGTVAYMAPERALGAPANFQTDVYSLGIILYQMLTLLHPFKRGSLKEFRTNLINEVLADPTEIAPYRDVPKVLARIATRCLSTDLKERYSSVDDLIKDIETYLEGRSEWIQIAELNVDIKEDWEFQENVLIAEHTAIVRETETSDWVSMMISKASFTENSKIESKVILGPTCHGIGFLLSVPESDNRLHLNDGYCLWLGSDIHPSTKLLRSTVEVMHHPDIFLQRNREYDVRLEKIDQNIYFYLNNVLQFSYISHLPLTGTHIGLLTRDADFTISPLRVSVGSLNIKVNCLAVPDAFLAHHDYPKALSEYRRIGYSFPGTAEGREALFRAGITLLEEARSAKDKQQKEDLFDLSLEEFAKLHATPGAPLEYLGKALVYQTLEDYEEEIKCFELAYRRYPHHPLLPVLEEQILYRMLENSRQNRKATYQFALFATRFIPSITAQANAKKLFSQLQRHWEPLPFVLKEENETEKVKNIDFAILLSFWLAKPYTLIEIIDELVTKSPVHFVQISNALMALIELGSYSLAKFKINELCELEQLKEHPTIFKLLEITISIYSLGFTKAFKDWKLTIIDKKIDSFERRAVLHMMRFALKKKLYKEIIEAAVSLESFEKDEEMSLKLNSFLIAAYLGEKRYADAEKELQAYPLEMLNHEKHPLHFLYGTWLYITEGKEIADIHFAGVMEVSFPRTWSLFSHQINSQIAEDTYWLNNSFMWEKRQLYGQAMFFYTCIGDEEKSDFFADLEATCYIYAKV